MKAESATIDRAIATDRERLSAAQAEAKGWRARAGEAAKRIEEMAKRMIARYDSKDQGVLTTEDVTARDKKVFALLDKNNDGKLEKRELRRGGKWHRHMKDGGDGME